MNMKLTAKNYTDAELVTEIIGLLRPIFYNPALLDGATESTQLIKDLDMDSARLVDVVLTLEERFDIHIDNEKMEKMQTIGDLVRVVREEVNAG